jgi:hypothetical protein
VTGDAAHGKGRVDAAAANADHRAVKHLDTLAVALDNAQVHAHLVARLDARVLALGRFQRFDQVRHLTPSFYVRKIETASPSAARFVQQKAAPEVVRAAEAGSIVA